MKPNLWQPIRPNINFRQINTLSGFMLATIAGVMVLRTVGGLQFLELVTFDKFLRLRPPEPMDKRVVIVGISEEDIQQAKTYPIPDRDIADLITRLQTYKPAVIGLDIVRDIPVEPGHSTLVNLFRTNRNVIGIEIALPDRSGYTTPPPPALPLEQVGFADTVLDTDGYQRRSLLGTDPAPNASNQDYRFSLPVRLAARYLETQGLDWGNGTQDETAMRFGNLELTWLQSNSGSYVGADAGGHQILLNVRSGQQPFPVFSLSQIKAGTLNPELIRGKIVLIGIMAFSVKDLVNSGAIAGINPGRIYGVEIQAHATSQIVNAVLDQRPLLNTWADGWEYLWILGWGLLGIGLIQVLKTSWKMLLGLGITIGLLISLCYGLVLIGWWVPVVPPLLILLINSVGLTAALFYRREQVLQERLEERQFIILETFDIIHNGPLQTLSSILRNAQTSPPSPPSVAALQRLNQEIRAVYGSMQREIFDRTGQLQVGGEIELALQAPLHELLYKVYCDTLERDLPHFKTIQIKIVQFEPLNTQHLRLGLKRRLCRFLEEMLCNVGKYAEGTTRLTVVCTQEGQRQIIRVIDNGIGIPPSAKTQREPTADQFHGMGTNLAEALAKQLGGTFRRDANQPKGTVCELTWTASKRWF